MVGLDVRDELHGSKALRCKAGVLNTCHREPQIKPVIKATRCEPATRTSRFEMQNRRCRGGQRRLATRVLVFHATPGTLHVGADPGLRYVCPRFG